MNGRLLSLIVLLLILSIDGCDIERTASQPEIPLWGRFETTVNNSKQYKNPFADVVLNAEFRSPDGRVVKFIGFYDGDGRGGQNGDVWKLRFCPDTPGEWNFSCRFSDGTPGSSGIFVCTENGARPGPLRIDTENPSRLVHPGGEKFFPRSNYFSELFTCPDSLRGPYLERFFGSGDFNLCCTVLWQGPGLVEHGWNALPFNGFYPLAGNDYTRLDNRSWNHLESVLSSLDSLGTVWFNFDGFVPNVGGRMGAQRLDPAAQRVFIRNAVARLAPYWNLIWNICFEWWEFIPADSVNALAAYVDSLDPWQHPLSVHDQGKFSNAMVVDSVFARLSLTTLQYDAGRCRSADSAYAFILRFSGSRPVYAQEVCWEAPPPYGEKLTADQVRACAWGTVLAGGILNYAEQFASEGGYVYGDGGAFDYLRIMYDFLDSVPYYEMRPADALAGPRAVCRALTGRVYVVYSQFGGEIDVDLVNTAGQFDIIWLDPKTGENKPAGTVTGGTVAHFTAPDNNDWVLYLRLTG